MLEKIDINIEEKNAIYNKYISGVSMRKLEEEYPYSFTFIQKTIKSYEFDKKIKENYPERDGFYIVAKCLKTNIFIDDYKNKSGSITNHLKKYYNIKIPSNYKRKSLEYKTGKYWYDEYFEFVYKKIKEIKKCYYCDWTTTDINNKSGAYEKHLKEIHNKTIEEYLKDNKKDEKYFKNYEDISKMGLVQCKICGKKMKIINNTHLKKHNTNVTEYKLKYGDDDIVSKGTKDKLSIISKNTNKFIKKSKTSKSENEIKLFLEENNIKVEQSKRKYLDGLEIDLFLPEYNIGIEYNGNLYHTEIYGKKTFNYHLNKTLIAAKKNINLYHLHEDEWEEKKEIIKNKLLYLLKKCNKKIHARKCIISNEIDNDIKKEFLNENHIQGNVKSKICIGAYYNNQLVSIMCFDNKRNMSKSKGHTNDIYELTRYAVKNGYVINGMASKLLNFFINQYNPNRIISFADRRWTPNQNDNLYIKLGFKCVNILKPDYKYYYRKSHRSGRLHKFGFGKNKLRLKYPNYFDINKTEWDMMQEIGYDRIWDCGKFKYEKIIKKGEN
jgi:hypothetical protein